MTGPVDFAVAGVVGGALRDVMIAVATAMSNCNNRCQIARIISVSHRIAESDTGCPASSTMVTGPCR
jgi:hypothetical protein